MLAALGPGARIVGGAVRDALLGRPVTDIDLATPLRPDEVQRRLEAARIRAVPTGIAHGTVTAVTPGRTIEITTLRRDVETDGRHAVVAFTDDWREDAARRDFTMNALSAEPDGTLHDPFGGVADARAGRVRFVGEPALRIDEDALRILRFFRFHAQLGQGELDAAGLAACAAGAERVRGLSGERVRTELLKLLGAPGAVAAWAAMEQAGLVTALGLPPGGTPRLERLVALERALGETDPLRRLAAILWDEPAAASRLALGTAERDRLGAALRGWAAPLEIEPLRAVIYRNGLRAVVDRLLLTADPGEQATTLNAVRAARDWTVPIFPLRGQDLLDGGMPAGPEIGALLRRLENRWIESGFTLSREALLAPPAARPPG